MEEELELFRVFKRDGAISRQARPARYAVDYAEGPGYGSRVVRLWQRTHGAYERMVACILVRDNQWPTLS